MSLLNEIEAHARHSNDRRAVAEAAERARQELEAQQARPLLQTVESYLRRVAGALNESDETVTVSYRVPDLGELKDLRQANYQVAKDPERDDALRFHFECSGKRPAKGALRSEALARKRETELVGSGLSCRRVAQSGERRALLVEPRVPVTLGFERSGAGLRLRTRNLQEIETRSYTLSPERVDEEFMEALLEVVLRRGNRLPQLTGDAISDTDRAQLRKELARQERRRRAELAGVFGRAVFPITETFRRMLLRQ